jgi:hypothetical protein
VDELRLERGLQVPRIEEVILDGVAGAGEVRVLKTPDGPHKCVLHIEGQARGDAVRIDLVRIEPLGLDENLVRGLVRKPENLVLDRRAVTRTHPLYDTREHGRAVRGGANQLVGALVCLRDETMDLLRVFSGAPEVRKHRKGSIAGLRGHRGVIEGPSVDARRGTSLQPPHPEGQLAQFGGKPVRRRIPGAATLVIVQAYVDTATQEGADGEHDTRRLEGDPGNGHHTLNTAVLNEKVGHLLLEEREVRLVLQHEADGLLVKLPIRLRASGAHRRPFARVERAELNARPIRRMCHGSTQGIDFPDEMAFANAPDRGVTAHLSERFDALREQQRAHTHAGRRKGSFGAGMTAADHNNLKGVRKPHGI